MNELVEKTIESILSTSIQDQNNIIREVRAVIIQDRKVKLENAETEVKIIAGSLSELEDVFAGAEKMKANQS